MKISDLKKLFFIPLPILLFSYSRGIPVSNIILILTTIASIISSFLIFKIIFLATKNKLYAALSLFIFTAWEVPYVSLYPNIAFSIIFGLLMCFLFLYFEKDGKQRYLFLAGISSFIAVVLYRYLFFLILFSPIVFFAFLPKNKILNFLTFLYGYIWGFIVFAIYLLFAGAFPLFVESFILYNGFNLALETLSIKTLIFFLLPFILIFLSSFLLLKRRKFHLLYLPCFMLIFSISIFPNLKNPLFLVLAISLSGILLSILMRYSANSTIRIVCIIFSVLLVLVGVII